MYLAPTGNGFQLKTKPLMVAPKPNEEIPPPAPETGLPPPPPRGETPAEEKARKKAPSPPLFFTGEVL